MRDKCDIKLMQDCDIKLMQEKCDIKLVINGCSLAETEAAIPLLADA